jgi:hypothetical protein
MSGSYFLSSYTALDRLTKILKSLIPSCSTYILYVIFYTILSICLFIIKPNVGRFSSKSERIIVQAYINTGIKNYLVSTGDIYNIFYILILKFPFKIFTAC